MKILQPLVSEIQKSAFFYHGVIAEGQGFKLETFQDGEIIFEDKAYVGAETPKLIDTEMVYDSDLELEVTVDIWVDKFFTITKDGEPVDLDDLIFDYYDEALNAFEEYLKRYNKLTTE